MTLKEYYQDLNRRKQNDFRNKWIQIKGLQRVSFYRMLTDAQESDIVIFAKVTGVEPTDIYKQPIKQLSMFEANKKFTNTKSKTK